MSKALDEILGELLEIQQYHESHTHGEPQQTVVTKSTRFANTIRTTRLLLQVFADQWTGTLHTPKPRGEPRENTGRLPLDDHCRGRKDQLPEKK